MHTAALLLVITTAAAADEGKQTKKDPITAEMRAVLVKANEVHNKMDQKLIDDAVEALHAEITRQPPEVFVPLAAPTCSASPPRTPRRGFCCGRPWKRAGWRRG